MFEIEDINLPSSPITFNKSSSKFFYDCYSQERELICPNSIFNEQRLDVAAPVPFSLTRPFEYSPLIKQNSDFGYSQADYVYTSNGGFASQSIMSGDKSLFSTPRVPPWRDIVLDVSLRSSADIAMAGFLPVTPFDTSALQPESFRDTERKICKAVEILRPTPRRSRIQNLKSIEVKRTKTNLPLFVTLRFVKRKTFLSVVDMSGFEREYQLPIFTKIVPLEIMISSGKYNDLDQIYEEPVFKLQDLLSKKRFVSRLTRAQLSQLLGLQKFDVSLVKDIENIVLDLCNQLCGLKIGEKSWSRNISRDLRRSSIIKVHKFASIFFPSFTLDHVQTIIKRGAYVRTQEFLRRKRRRAKRLIAQKRVRV